MGNRICNTDKYVGECHASTVKPMKHIIMLTDCDVQLGYFASMFVQHSLNSWAQGQGLTYSMD